MVVGYINGAALGEALSVEHGAHTECQAAKHGAVHVDGHLLQALAQREPPFPESLFVAVFNHIESLDILVGRPKAEGDALAGMGGRLVTVNPLHGIGARQAVSRRGEHSVGGVGHGVLAVHRPRHDAVDAPLQRRQLHSPLSTLHSPLSTLHSPCAAVVLAHIIYILREAAAVVGTVDGLYHSFGEHRRGHPHGIRLAQSRHAHPHRALLRRAVDIGQLHLHRRQLTHVGQNIIQAHEQALIAHAQGGLGIMALAIEVGDGNLHRVVEDGLGGEFHTAVGFGGEDHPEGAVGGSLGLALRHHGAHARPPTPHALAPSHAVLHPRAADADAAVGRRHALHGVGLAELRRSALGREAHHEARLLVLLDPQAEHVAAGAVAHPHRPVARQAVGGQRQGAVGRAEVVGGEFELLHLLPVGVKENKVKSMACSQQLAVAPVGAVEQHSHLHRVARTVDGAVADHVELRAAAIGRRITAVIDRLCNDIAVANDADDAVAQWYAIETVGAVGSGDDGLQQLLILCGIVLLGL